MAHLLDLGVPCERVASMVGLEATEMSVRVTDQAMQLDGGNGYTTERQVERHWRDARLTTIVEGTSEIRKRTISARLLPRSPLVRPGERVPGPSLRDEGRWVGSPPSPDSGNRSSEAGRP